MAPSSGSNPSVHDSVAARLRQIPSIDELLQRSRLLALVETAGHSAVAAAARKVLSDLRERIKSGRREAGAPPDLAALEAGVAAEVEASLAPSLRPVINATGVILHTNLGRAPLSPAVARRIAETATHYSNLEYDLEKGARGKRDTHTAHALAEIVGAEAAIVVNNNAAAVFLVLNTLAKGQEVIVSRGELIEIGDGFRIPDIMAESGAELKEVGTTNRTRLRDYENAIGERTRLLLRVHPSNFRITGFTERPSLVELASLAEKRGLPLYEDLGSGCLVDLSTQGIYEPVAKASIDGGVSVVTFSGDKMLGGPQAGIIAGRKDIVSHIRRNPLFRALRVDKLTISALEVTLNSYRRGAYDEIPALRMIRQTREQLQQRAVAFVGGLRSQVPGDVKIEILGGFSVIGGGSTPDQQLPSEVITIQSSRHSSASLEERLRKPARSVPVIARIEDERLVIDLRTVFPEEESSLAAAIVAALR
ncbi:MAG TPA: L-seryl-tRNA(Sec) selenium transferase [Candidatus Acidoferrum sp.]|nr:L-seryl-tRNA(Sec) selenium transferase [Candidatus Acidoferrum sp.]